MAGSKSLGVLSIDMIANLGGFTQGLDKAERQAKGTADVIRQELNSAVTIAASSFAALGTAATAAFAVFKSHTDSLDAFNDLKDVIGGSVENLSALERVARENGESLATVQTALVKFNMTLTGTEEEGKGASDVLKNLGLNVDALKKLDPSEALRQTAVAFAQFADDGSKARNVQVLFGKSVAEVGPFLKDLAEKTELVGTVSTKAAQDAELFNKQLSRLKSDSTDAARSIVANLLPAMNSLLANFIALKKQGSIGAVIKDAAVDLFSFGQKSNLSGDPLADMNEMLRERERIGKNIAFAEGKGRPTDGLKKDLTELNKLIDYTSGRLGRLQAGDTKLAGREDRGFDPFPKGKLPEPSKGGGKSKIDNTAEQEAKARLAADLDAYKLQLQAFTDANANNEKILSAMRSAGLVEDKQYYDDKLKLLNVFSEKQIDEQLKAIERLNLEQDKQNFTGKDQIENDRKIAAAEAALMKIRADAIAQVKVLGIESKSSADKTISAMLAANQAAKSFLDTLKAGYDLEISGIGRGDKFKQQASELQSLNEGFEQKRQDLRNRRALAEQSDTFGPEARRRYDDELALIASTNAEAVKLFQERYAKINAAQGDWLTGATSALENYRDSTKDVAKGIGDIFGSTFKGLEDELTNLGTGKKVDLKSLLSNFNADVMRQIVRTNITGPLAEGLNGQLKSGDGAGGWLKSYFDDLFPKGQQANGGIAGLVGGTSGAASLTSLTAASSGTAAALATMTASIAAATAALSSLAASSGGSSVASTFGNLGTWGTGTGTAFDSWGFASGGYTGSGGRLQPAGIVHKGEYVMNAATTRRMGVSALDNISRGGNGGSGPSHNITVNVLPGATRETGYQAARAMARALSGSTAR